MPRYQEMTECYLGFVIVLDKNTLASIEQARHLFFFLESFIISCKPSATEKFQFSIVPTMKPTKVAPVCPPFRDS